MNLTKMNLKGNVHILLCLFCTGVPFVDCHSGKEKGAFKIEDINEVKLVPIGAIGNKAFYFQNTDMTWGSAVEFCLDNQMTLAALETEEENNLVKDWMFANRWWYGWIAGTDLFRTKGNFYWLTSNEPLSYTDWGDGYPKGGPGRSCIELWVSQTDVNYTGWQDYTCGAGGKSKPICQLT